MTRKKNSAKKVSWKELMSEDADFLKPLMREVVQQVLEAEMDEALGAQKSERTGERVGYRSGYYNRTLITRVGKLELRGPQDRQGAFGQTYSSATSGVKRRWWAPWRRCTFKAFRRER